MKECCNNCAFQKELIKFDYQGGGRGCEHTKMDGYACIAFANEGQIIWMYGNSGNGQCELYAEKETKKG